MGQQLQCRVELGAAKVGTRVRASAGAGADGGGGVAVACERLVAGDGGAAAAAKVAHEPRLRPRLLRRSSSTTTATATAAQCLLQPHWVVAKQGDAAADGAAEVGAVAPREAVTHAGHAHRVRRRRRGLPPRHAPHQLVMVRRARVRVARLAHNLGVLR